MPARRCTARFVRWLRAFSAEAWHWPELEDVEPLDLELVAWSPDEAADEFAKRYAELDARR